MQYHIIGILLAINVVLFLGYLGSARRNKTLINGMLAARYVLFKREFVDVVVIEFLEQSLKQAKVDYEEKP